MRGRNVTILDTDFQKSSHDWVRESSDKCLANVQTYVANEENSIRQYIKQSRCDILCVDSHGSKPSTRFIVLINFNQCPLARQTPEQQFEIGRLVQK